ncbi:cyclic GMP-AMP synthase DncV-like nucleotidyltransferase [Pseudomonas lini]
MGGCSALFYDSDNQNTLFSRISLSDKQLKTAREGRDALLGFVKPKLSEVFDVEVKHWIQGSLKNHTLIRPTSKFEEFDIDVGLYLIGDGDESGIDAVDIKSDLHDAIVDYCQFDSNARVPDEVKERCERVVFSGDFHIDMPLYYFNSQNDTVVLATENGWEHSDPKGFQDWFESSVGVSQRPIVRRVIKYLKAWASLKANSSLAKPLSSMALTILVVEFIDLIGSSDDESDFSRVAQEIVNCILESESVINPLTGSDILSFSKADIDYWRPHLLELEEVSSSTKKVEDAFVSFYLWERIFGHMLPPINETAISGGRTGLPAVTSPALTEVRHYDSKGVLLSSEVTSSVICYKNESLSFRVFNSDEYHPDASISWIVRNQGGDAADSNDLGHNTPLGISAEISRDCAYTGVHYMDATVVYRGQVLGVGKVKVNIQPYNRPVKNPIRRRIYKGGR